MYDSSVPVSVGTHTHELRAAHVAKSRSCETLHPTRQNLSRMQSMLTWCQYLHGHNFHPEAAGMQTGNFVLQMATFIRPRSALDRVTSPSHPTSIPSHIPAEWIKAQARHVVKKTRCLRREGKGKAHLVASGAPRNSLIHHPKVQEVAVNVVKSTPRISITSEKVKTVNRPKG